MNLWINILNGFIQLPSIQMKGGKYIYIDFFFLERRHSEWFFMSQLFISEWDQEINFCFKEIYAFILRDRAWSSSDIFVKLKSIQLRAILAALFSMRMQMIFFLLFIQTESICINSKKGHFVTSLWIITFQLNRMEGKVFFFTAHFHSQIKLNLLEWTNFSKLSEGDWAKKKNKEKRRKKLFIEELFFSLWSFIDKLSYFSWFLA